MSTLADRFDAAVKGVRQLPPGQGPTDNETLLDLYSLFKVASTGSADPTESRPGMFDFKGRAKWDSWKACTATNADEAMERYIALAKRLGWVEGGEGATEGQNALSQGAPDQPGWARVSRVVVPGEEGATSTDLHDAVAEGNLQTVEGLLKQEPSRVNERDSAGNTPLHIAADRGRTDLASLLLSKGADVTAKDGDGQTPLDAAKLAEQSELVSLLSK